MSGSISVSTTVAASPDDVYALVADLGRMGEWSPEAAGVRWVGGATGPRPGARFRGRNRNRLWRWQTTCTVVTADPGRELSWRSSLLGLPVALWRYQFEADGSGGTNLTESTQDQRGFLVRTLAPAGTGIGDRATRNRETMAVTLARIKAELEHTAP